MLGQARGAITSGNTLRTIDIGVEALTKALAVNHRERRVRGPDVRREGEIIESRALVPVVCCVATQH